MKYQLKFTKKNVSLKISWKKVNKASGYQIQYAENASFKKKRKTKTCGAKKQTFTIKGLKRGKKYYIRIRAYRKNIYGKWTVKKVVIKK